MHRVQRAEFAPLTSNDVFLMPGARVGGTSEAFEQARRAGDPAKPSLSHGQMGGRTCGSARESALDKTNWPHESYRRAPTGRGALAGICPGTKLQNLSYTLPRWPKRQ